MPKSDEYRQCAAECVKLAAKATDLHDKALLLAMADRWRDLADRVAVRAALESGAQHQGYWH